MANRLRRWYEKNEYLRVFMELLSDLTPEIQSEIAVDIIMRASELSDKDYKNIIEGISSYDPRSFNRWYDKNPNIHIAIETIRELTDEQRDVIVREFSNKIVNHHYSKPNGIYDY